MGNEQLKKFKAAGQKRGLSEDSMYLFKRLMAEIDRLENLIIRTNLKFAGRKMTLGGSATEEFEILGLKKGMHIVASMRTEGASPVSIKSVKTDLNKLIVEFSADPAADHELTYVACL